MQGIGTLSTKLRLCAMLVFPALFLFSPSVAALDPADIEITHTNTSTSTGTILVSANPGSGSSDDWQRWIFFKIKNNHLTESITGIKLQVPTASQASEKIALGRNFNMTFNNPFVINSGFPTQITAQATQQDALANVHTIWSNWSQTTNNSVIPPGGTRTIVVPIYVYSPDVSFTSTLTMKFSTATGTSTADGTFPVASPKSFQIRQANTGEMPNPEPCPQQFTGVVNHNRRASHASTTGFNCIVASSCPTDYEGTPPYCTAIPEEEPPTGGGSEPTDLTERDKKFVSLILASGVGFMAIRSFRWRGTE